MNARRPSAYLVVGPFDDFFFDYGMAIFSLLLLLCQLREDAQCVRSHQLPNERQRERCVAVGNVCFKRYTRLSLTNRRAL